MRRKYKLHSQEGIYFVSFVLIHCILNIYNCSSVFSQGKPEFGYVGTYYTSGLKISAREDYYYVKNFISNDSNYYNVLRFAKALNIDSSKEHSITFMRYSETLPDTLGYSDDNDLMGGQFDNFLVLTYFFDGFNKTTSVIYFNNGKIIKVEDIR